MSTAPTRLHASADRGAGHCVAPGGLKSINTVSSHLKQIYEKLQVHSKTEAVARALRERLI